MGVWILPSESAHMRSPEWAERIFGQDQSRPIHFMFPSSFRCCISQRWTCLPPENFWYYFYQGEWIVTHWPKLEFFDAGVPSNLSAFQGLFDVGIQIRRSAARVLKGFIHEDHEVWMFEDVWSLSNKDAVLNCDSKRCQNMRPYWMTVGWRFDVKILWRFDVPRVYEFTLSMTLWHSPWCPSPVTFSYIVMHRQPVSCLSLTP